MVCTLSIGCPGGGSSTGCTNPATDEYTSAICDSGGLTTAGSDTLIADCSTVDAGEYVEASCTPGSSSEQGEDSTISDCAAIANCESGLSCSNDTDSICTTCETGYEFSMDSSTCVTQGMVLVPSADFWMGCNDSVDTDCSADESPYHEISVDAFFIDETEVTAGSYKDCVDAGTRSYNGSTMDATRNYNNGRDAHPMNFVSWTEAQDYCQWQNKRLPTEAEWEKAARGADGRKYPWGNDDASCEFAVVYLTSPGCDTDQTMEVGNKTAGASPYGALDMSGNVSEWTADFYSDTYYSESSDTNNGTGNWNLSCDTRRLVSGYRFDLPVVISPKWLRLLCRFGCGISLRPIVWSTVS